MAIYHLSAQILGRAPKVDKARGVMRPGSSVVAAAAYRSGERLQDARTEKSHDYSNRKGVAHCEIMAPDYAPPWVQDRATLWNTVEAMEERKDAQLAREINIALPHELSHDQRLELVREFVQTNFVSKGMVADVAWHDPVPDAGQNSHNFHAHIMLTLRRATPEGLDRVKTREWNSVGLLDTWRSSWAAHVNDALRSIGRADRVDHRTLKAQREAALERGDRRAAARLDRTPEIHVGPTARQVDAKLKQRRQSPQSGRLEAGAFRQRGEGGRPERRERDYTARDKGTRVDWLSNILLGNNEKAKAQLVKTERQIARLERKLHYWDKQTSFKLEGVVRGSVFRFERAKQAQEQREARERERQRQHHAAKRAENIKQLIGELEKVFLAARAGREAVLARRQELAGWLKTLGRGSSRQQTVDHHRAHERVRER